MIAPEQIPDEVVEMLSSDTGMNVTSMRYSLAAALTAWPGAARSATLTFEGRANPLLILPLPEDAADE
jgi:hypothetical protein